MEEKFKEILAQYCTLEADEISPDSRFREDLGLSSLDFATLLGELEDEFDLEFDEGKPMQATTVGEALEILEGLA
jgi:acyl carrier protein